MKKRIKRTRRLTSAYLGSLARFRLRRCHEQIIGITGSIGKSGTRAAIVKVLESQFSIARSVPDYNTQLSLLSSLFRQKAGDQSVNRWLLAMAGATRDLLTSHEKYDKLVLGINTNGAVRPEDAIGFAAKLLKDQLQMFINFDEAPIDAQEIEVNEEQERIVELLSRNVEELELSVRSANCLKSGNIKTLFDLVTKNEQEMLKFRNFGRKSLNEIGEILEGM